MTCIHRGGQIVDVEKPPDEVRSYAMIVKLFRHGSCSEVLTGISSNCDIVAELQKRFPELDAIRIEGQNFTPISTRSHYGAAGYPVNGVPDDVLTGPAHFNPPFFQIRNA